VIDSEYTPSDPIADLAKTVIVLGSTLIVLVLAISLAVAWANVSNEPTSPELLKLYIEQADKYPELRPMLAEAVEDDFVSIAEGSKLHHEMERLQSIEYIRAEKARLNQAGGEP